MDQSDNIKKLSLGSIKHSFSGKTLSPFGGMAIVRSILEKMDFSSKINQHFPVFNFRKELSIGILFEQIITTMLCGGTCIHDTKILDDLYLKELFGWKRIPDDHTYSVRFQEFKQPDVRKLRRDLRNQSISKLKDDNLFISIDPTVDTVYGNQEGAAVGYNPKNRGRKSYFPYIAYEYRQRRILDAMLRPGNTSNTTDLVDFIKPLLVARRRKGVTVRLDKGCASAKILDLIHEYGQYYVGKAKMFSPIWDAIEKVKDWKPLGHERLVGEFFYKGKRHIVVEQLTNKKGEQLNLWGKSEAKVSVVVTNRPDKAETIWRMYNKGAMVETAIKELKNDLSALDFRTQSFCANEIFMLLGVVASNIAQEIREAPELREHQFCALKKLRWLILKIPAIISKSSRYIKVKLNKQHTMQDIFWCIYRKFIPI